MTGDFTSHLTSAATRTCLGMARVLTEHTDDRIPTELPANLPEQNRELVTALGQLERVAADYAERAYIEQSETADAQARAYALLLFTRTAADIMQMAVAQVQTITDDYAAAHMNAEAALLSVMTWALCTGKDRELLTTTASNYATFTAGANLATTVREDEPVDARRAAAQLERAYAERADAFSAPVAEKVALSMARDAFSLGVESLASGDLARARRFLTFASVHGIAAAGELLATERVLRHRDELAQHLAAEQERVDFATDPDAWRLFADATNRSVRFLAATGPASTTAPDPEGRTKELPCMVIGGVQVYAYLNGETGALRVSVDLDDTAAWLVGEDDVVPLEIAVQGETVFTG
jgi:hypothetical protein